MHTTKQIIENQKLYREQILRYFIAESIDTRKVLLEIKTTDEYILQEKSKLLKRFSKISTVSSIDKYFFVNKKRDANYYIWWDDATQEPRLLKYAKK